MTRYASEAQVVWEVTQEVLGGRIRELEAEVADLKRALNEVLDCPFHSHDEPVPFLPVDPEEQRRMNTVASDGQQAMIYRRPEAAHADS